jgi:YD repeat-containing protein
MPERAVVPNSTISGGYDRFGNLNSSYTVTSGRYIYWSDPSDVVGESTPVFVWRTVGSSTWNTISAIEKVFNGARARFLGVKVAAMGTGNIEYQVRYFRSGEATPFAVRTGTVNNPSTATGVTDTTAASITSTKTLAPSVSQTVDRWGNVLTSTDAFGAVTTHRYNQFGQLIEKKLPSVAVVSVNAAGAMTSTTGTPTSLQYYDALGRLIATRDGNGNVDALTLNAAGQATRNTHANGYFDRYTYDAFGNKIAETNERNFITQYTYNGRNLLTKTVHDAGATPTFAAANLITTQFFYDEAGRRVAVTDGNNLTSRTWYDLVGNIRQTSTPLGYSKTYEYDLRGTKTKETDEIGGVRLWTYDYFGRIQNHNELGSASTPGVRHDYQYNKAGLAISVTSTVGQNVSYKYDEAGHLTEVRESGTAAAGSGLVSVPRTSRYRYDLAGRHSREITIIYNRIEQDALISYDAAGRLAAMWDKNGGTKISYDAAGNRTRIQSSAAASQDNVTFTSSPFTFTWSTSYLISSGWFTQTDAWNTVDTDLWYAYDNMNRMAISRGALSGSTVSGGVKFTYDEVGNKKTRAENGYVYTMGSGGKMNRTTGLSTDTYTYDGANRITDVNKDGTVIEHYDYDKGSRQTTAVTRTVDVNSGSFLVTRTQSMYYNNDSRLTSTSTTRATTDPSNTGTRTESVVTYDSTDAAGVVRSYKVDAYKADGSGIQYTLRYNQAYRLGESYQATVLSMTKTFGTGGPNNNTTTQSYDLDGNLALFQDQGAPDKNRNYAVNADGQIIGNGKSRYFFANGQNVGSLLLTSRQYVPYAESLVSGFAFNVDDGVVSGADVQTPSTIAAQDKDTLRTIAQRLWGDSSLWYLLAGENGLSDPDAQLVEGMIIRVPNEVVSVGNNAAVYKPFDVTSAIGNTSPEQIFPYVPPPPAKKGCGVIGMIIMVVVAIVVAYFTAGAATGLVASAMNGMGIAGATVAGTTAASVAAVGGAALAAAAGSIVSQGVGIAIGAQDKFSWGAVGKAFIGGAVGGALFGVQGAGMEATKGLLSGSWVSTQAFGSAAPYIQAGLNSAISNVLTQGISVAVGLQDKFSWREVASSAAGGVAGHAVKSAIGDSLKNNLGEIPGKIIGNTAIGIANGVAQSVVRGGKIDVVSIAADAFGNAIGNAIVESAIAHQERKELLSAIDEYQSRRRQQVPNGQVELASLAPVAGVLGSSTPGDLVLMNDVKQFLRDDDFGRIANLLGRLEQADIDRLFGLVKEGRGFSMTDMASVESQRRLQMFMDTMGFDGHAFRQSIPYGGGMTSYSYSAGDVNAAASMVLGALNTGLGADFDLPAQRLLYVRDQSASKEDLFGAVIHDIGGYSDPAVYRDLHSQVQSLSGSNRLINVSYGYAQGDARATLRALNTWYGSAAARNLDLQMEVFSNALENAGSPFSSPEGLEGAAAGVVLGSMAVDYSKQISYSTDDFAPAQLRDNARTSLFLEAALTLAPGIGAAGRLAVTAARSERVANIFARLNFFRRGEEVTQDLRATYRGTRALPSGAAGMRPAYRYQRLVTDKDYEEVWQIEQRQVMLDGHEAGFTVETKWGGRNDRAWESSPLNPDHRFYKGDDNLLDQARRQLQFNSASNGRGVRWAVSNDAQRDFYDSLFRQHFPREMNNGTLRVWTVPGDGM